MGLIQEIIIPLTDPAIPVNYRSSRAKKKENKITTAGESRIAN